MKANNCRYFNILVAKITATTANEYFKIAKSDFCIFVEGRDIVNNTTKEIFKTCKIKKFNSYFYYLYFNKC